MARKSCFGIFMNVVAMSAMVLTSACAMVDVPDSRGVQIPPPRQADIRKKAINERPDSVMYLPLGEDVLVPEVAEDDSFPSEMVGPFELRGETLAGALQLILADYDISLAFETEEGLTRRITVANLRGDLGKVVHQVCSLANLYCSYEDGTIVVKDTQTFTVTLPPIGTDDEDEFLDDVAEGLGAILNPGGDTSAGQEPIVDPTTRTIVYSATQRTADIASRYFQRLRANTAMIVFETYIWEVSLNSGNSMGVDWFKLAQFSKFNTGISIDGSVGADFTNPISIGIPTASGEFDGETGDLLEFLSQFGAVKTISQPQITVLSGSEAELRVADTQNYVSQIATTLSEGQATTSVNTDSVDTGFTLTIGSTWDKATVYANVNIELTDVKQIDNFAFSDTSADPTDPTAESTQTRIQLPQTSERQLSTQIRVRPGDSVLIAGLVRENDNFDERGLGIMEPLLPDSRTAQAENLELVILLRPRVVVYTASNDKRYVDFAMKKHKLPGTGVEVTSPKELGEPVEHGNVYPAAEPVPVVEAVQEEIPSGIAAPLTANPVPTSPAPVSVQPLALPPPVPVVPSSTVTPSWESSAAPARAPEPAAAPMPILRDTAPPPSDNESRFRRGSGFVSKSGGAPSSSVTTYPLTDAAPPPMPAPVPAPSPAPVPAPAQSPSTPSAYDTYDYYTPAY
jgi:hypothetical protein